MNKNKRIKVLLLYNKVWRYRIDVFDIVNDYCDFTVAYYTGEDEEQHKFKTKKLDVINVKGFIFHKDNLNSLCQNYDVVINGFDLHLINQQALLLNKNRKFKLINYGINTRASYSHSYGEKSIVDYVRYFLAKRADAMLFYSSEPLKRYIKAGLSSEKLFVANNTVKVLPIELDFYKKNTFLFVGTLYAQKGINSLLECYKEVSLSTNNFPNLIIVGGGEGLDYVKRWIVNNKLEEKIIAKGPIYDEELLRKLHSEAIVSISPNQAGLSVLKSFGYGVPFITNVNAITGGEIFNIKNGENGFLYDTKEELVELLRFAASERKYFYRLGEAAFNYYHESRTIESMAQGFIDAISYVNNLDVKE